MTTDNRPQAVTITLDHALFFALSVDFVPTLRDVAAGRRALAESLRHSRSTPAALHSGGHIVSANDAALLRGISIGMPAADALRRVPTLRLSAVETAEAAHLGAVLASILRFALLPAAFEGPIALNRDSAKDRLSAAIMLPQHAAESTIERIRDRAIRKAERLSLAIDVQIGPARAGNEDPVAEPFGFDRISTPLYCLSDVLFESVSFEIGIERAAAVAASVATPAFDESMPRIIRWTLTPLESRPQARPSENTTECAECGPACTVRMEGGSRLETLASDLARGIGRIAQATGGARIQLDACAGNAAPDRLNRAADRPNSTLAAELLEQFGRRRVFQLGQVIPEDACTKNTAVEATFLPVFPTRFGRSRLDAPQNECVIDLPAANARPCDRPAFLLPEPQRLPVRAGRPWRHGPVRLLTSGESIPTERSADRIYYRGEDETRETLWLYHDGRSDAWYLAGRYL